MNVYPADSCAPRSNKHIDRDRLINKIKTSVVQHRGTTLLIEYYFMLYMPTHKNLLKFTS